MEQKNWQMLRALINSYYQGSAEKFLFGMDAEKIQQITSIPISAGDASLAIIKPEEFFENKIHYSWIADLLKTLKDSSKELFIVSLPSSIALALYRLLDYPQTLSEPPPFVKKFFLSQLAKKIGIQEITPVAFLPQEQLTYLSEFNKEQLVKLVEFLSLYDLAEEIKSIVDKVTLQKIYNSLSVPKQQFLRSCLHQKDRLSNSKMGLSRWQGDEEQLQRLLHRRGLLRLAYALSGHHPDLLWHLSHRLDSGRGRLLEKSYSSKEIPAVTIPLRQQVLNIVNFFKKTG